VSNADARLHALSMTAAAGMIAAQRVSARALADAQLARIAATDAAIHAWATLDPALVRASADRCEHARGPLAGIGIGVKDIIATRALPTAMGLPFGAEQCSTADAAVVERLSEAGGYVFGKTVTTELAFMHPGKTRNPWNAAHTPGGSSSGSAAAVAAGHVCAALGTQTNGSIIRPAAYCGVVGFKPTFGMVPYAGVMVFSETLDTLGTLTRSVADAAHIGGVLAGDGRIPTALAPL
jgi:Asp-tRNA(Asn)/Glu-tRNA(Gln) amidotransferase A subunit family amidase